MEELIVGMVSSTFVVEVAGVVEVEIVVAGGAVLVLVAVAVVIFNM
jgi:hypothetical protein